jgi:hypothetical protein
MVREEPLPFEVDGVRLTPASNQPMSDPPLAQTVPAAAQVDVYGLIVDRLVSFCSEARTVDDVVKAFSIEPAQAKAWLARGVKDGALRKRMKPVRYESVTESSLFATSS